jgi:hypothetical protein
MLDKEERINETIYSDERGIGLSEARIEELWRKEDIEMKLEIPHENPRIHA